MPDYQSGFSAENVDSNIGCEATGFFADANVFGDEV